MEDEWELLPDHRTCFFMEGKDHHQLFFVGTKLVMLNMDHFNPTTHPSPCGCLLDQETKKIVHEPLKELKEEQSMAKVTDGEEEVIGVDEEEEAVVVEASGGCEGEGREGMGSEGRWRVSGIGALCSFGVAAATICIFLLGGRQQQEQQRLQHVQIYADDNKRIKQVVQQASRLNQAMSSVATRASISFGGYCDAL